MNIGTTLFLPNVYSIALHKGELAMALNISAYKLKTLIKQHEKALEKMGYRKYDKVLYPAHINYLCQRSGLRINEEILAQIVGNNVLRL